MILLNKAESLINAIITKIDNTTKPRNKFILHLLILYMGLRGKYNFINMARYGSYTEQTYQNQISKPFDWATFNKNLIEQHFPVSEYLPLIPRTCLRVERILHMLAVSGAGKLKL